MRKLGRVVAFIVGIYLAWVIGRPLGVTLTGPFLSPFFGDNLLPEWVIGFIGMYAVVGLVPALIGGVLGASKSEASTTTFRRRTVGLIGRGIIAAVIVVLFGIATKMVFAGIGFFVPALFEAPAPHAGPVNIGDVFGIVRLLVFVPVWIGVAVWLVMTCSRPLKILVGRKTQPYRRNVRLSLAGYGGSASFAGLLEEWAHPYEPGAILLGNSLYDPSWRIGITDDRHVATIAGTGAGKGRNIILPNLLEWPYSAVVIDPKGTNAAVTAAARGNGGGRVKKGMGQKVYCLNPFNVNWGVPGMPPRSCFNPLSALSNPPLSNEIDQIAESIIVPAQGNSSHFTDAAQAIIAGLIDLVIKKKENPNLGQVRDYLVGSRKEMVDHLDEAGGIAKAAAQMIDDAGDAEMGSFFTTCLNQTRWLDDLNVRRCLETSDFNFMALQKEPMTIYLILPPSETKRQARFLRLFVNLAYLAALSANRDRVNIDEDGVITPVSEKRVPVLYVLDEFFNLGEMPTLTSAAALIRSAGIKLWPFVQNLGQLVELYGKNWQTFQGNAGFSNYFSMNDPETLDYLAKRMGDRVSWQPDQTGNMVAGRIAKLRTGEEVGRETGRAGGRSYVIREGEDPMVISRLNYDQFYAPDRYNPDPDRGLTDVFNEPFELDPGVPPDPWGDGRK
jgi:type IV secretion system protein VirD4